MGQGPFQVSPFMQYDLRLVPCTPLFCASAGPMRAKRSQVRRGVSTCWDAQAFLPFPIWGLSSQDGCLLDAQASDHLFGGRVTGSETQACLKTTCSEVDSQGAPAFHKAGDARAWIDAPQPLRSKECERSGAGVLGTFSARAPGRSAESLVRRLRGFTPSGPGGF